MIAKQEHMFYFAERWPRAPPFHGGYWGSNPPTKQITGALTLACTPSVTNGAYGLEVDNSGQYLYVANHLSKTVSMFSINQNSGLLTALAPATVTAGTNPRFIRLRR